MKISIKNLGVLKQADLSLGELTVICGGNNMGKTYAAYALFGFLKFWRNAYLFHISDEWTRQLLDEGRLSLDIDKFIADEVPGILEKGCVAYTKQLSRIFASSDKYFSESSFEVMLEPGDIQPLPTYEHEMGTAKTSLFSLEKKDASRSVEISLLVERQQVQIAPDLISANIASALKDILFERLFPDPFLASTERTGAAIFRNDLTFTRNSLLDGMSSMDKDFDPSDLLTKIFTSYPLPVTLNADFTRQLENVARKSGEIAKNHPEILDDFVDIIGGEYHVPGNNALYYTPSGKSVRLSMKESSSSVRSLLDIGFYLRHVAAPGDLLMIDEPELNLHPENQRRVARLLARLANIGIKVFITTHSDYIVKELNTLIMLNQNEQRLKELAARENFKNSELLSHEKIRAYIAEEPPGRLDGAKQRSKCVTLTPADIDSKRGIEARSFDTTIDAMNRIQDEIIWGGNE